MTVTDRRTILLAWLSHRNQRGPLTATEIVDGMVLYKHHGRYDRCFDDLKWLARNGRVKRHAGRPARWSA